MFLLSQLTKNYGLVFTVCYNFRVNNSSWYSLRARTLLILKNYLKSLQIYSMTTLVLQFCPYLSIPSIFFATNKFLLRQHYSSCLWSVELFLEPNLTVCLSTILCLVLCSLSSLPGLRVWGGECVIQIWSPNTAKAMQLLNSEW